MSANIRYEVALLAMSFLTGIGLMMVYDCLRVLRILCPHRPIWTGIEDVFYWIYTSIIVFTLIYQENDGNIRGYIIITIFCAMVLYQWLVSRKFLKCLKNIVKCLKMKIGRHKMFRDRGT